MTEKIDPELAPEPEDVEEDVEEIDLPEYDPTQFELDDDFEYEEADDGEEDEE